MNRKNWLFTIVFTALIILSGCNSNGDALIVIEEELLEQEEGLKQLKDELKEKKDELTSKETNLNGLMKELDEKLNVSVAENANSEHVDRLDLPFNPNQEGIYNGEYYSGEIGMSGPGEYHTVKDAEEMGYEVILIDYNENVEMIVDVPPMEVDGHIEGDTWEHGNGKMEYNYTILLDLFEGRGIAKFTTDTGEEIEYDVTVFN